VIPVAHIGGVPVEETVAAGGPALLLALGVVGARLRAGLGGRRALIAGLVATVVVAALAITAASASAATLFANETPITIPTQGSASPYPSTIDVQGLPGRITDLAVNLRGVSHSAAADLDVLLVSPEGSSSVVMSDACAATGIQSLNLTFSEAAAVPLPAQGPCFGGLHRPTDYEGGGSGDDFWPGAASSSGVPNLDQFVGDNPNGTWSLRVRDDRATASGAINQGWTLTLETAVPDIVVPRGDGSGAANPYPATRTVSAGSGVVKDVDVSVSGLYHEGIRGLDLLLVGPRGQHVMLMSNACANSPVKNASWVWDDEAAGQMGAGDCPTLTRYKPSSYAEDALPAPAPPRPYGTALSVFDGSEPNGDWRLFVFDFFPAAPGGFVVEPFGLQIETRPKAKVGFAAGAVEVTEGQARQVTLTRSAGGETLGAGSVTVTSAPQSASSGTDYKPVSTTVVFAPGETQKTVAVEALTDAVREGPESFALTIGSPTGDADPGTPATAAVTIRDATPAPTETPAPVTETPTAGQTPTTTLPGSVAPVVGPVVDRDAPLIGGLRVRGRTVRYALSEPASVTVRLLRGKRRVATLRHAGTAGANRAALRGLRPGRYRLVLTAADAAGNRSTSRARTFRVAG
jgi:subtilisin-like proprotein convertase family protein